MPQQFNTFIHLVFIGFVALFPVVNPIGSAFIVSPYFLNVSRAERIKYVKKIALYCFIICAVTVLVGHWILELFGLSIPVVQLAGGIMICKIGWEFLSADDKEVPQKKVSDNVETEPIPLVANKLFYPITFPITAGAGTIAVLFTLSAHGASADISTYLLNICALLVSIVGVCTLVFIFYLNTNRLIGYIGERNEQIINRFMAFLIFCVGLQIAAGGITSLVKLHFRLH
jgi:multiple antibiotic resistance protein